MGYDIAQINTLLRTRTRFGALAVFIMRCLDVHEVREETRPRRRKPVDSEQARPFPRPLVLERCNQMQF